VDRVHSDHDRIWADVRRLFAEASKLEQGAGRLLGDTKKMAKRPLRKANKRNLQELVQEAAQIQMRLTEVMAGMTDEDQEYLLEASDSLSTASYLLEQIYSGAVAADE
jgi:hypothetical protein